MRIRSSQIGKHFHNIQSKVLYEAGTGMSSTDSIDEILELTINTAISIPGIAGAAVWLNTDEENNFLVASAKGKTLANLQCKVPLIKAYADSLRSGCHVDIEKWISVGSEHLSAVLIPITTGKQLIGVLEIVANGNSIFCEKVTRLLELLVNISAVSINRAKLSSKVNEELQGLRWISETTSKIEIDQGIDDVLNAIVKAGKKLLQSDRIGIYLVDDSGLNLCCTAHIGLSDSFNNRIHDIYADVSIESLDLVESVLYCEDISNASNTMRAKDVLISEGIQSGIAVRLECNNRSIGVLVAFYDQPHRMNQTLLQIVETLAAEAAVAINYAKLLETSKSLVTRLESANRKLEVQAVSDGLTGLANHRAFHQRLSSEIRRAERYKESFSLVMFDVDKFKSYNDTFGHREGDNALQLVSQITGESLRATDFPARYGGEEFAIILPHTGKQQAFNVVERMRKRIQQCTSAKRQITISCGLCEFPTDGTSPTELIDKADRALYHAKISGRNMTCSWGNTEDSNSKTSSTSIKRAEVRTLVIGRRTAKNDCSTLLSSTGYPITTACSDQDALDLLKNYRFDVLICEVPVFLRDDLQLLASAINIHPSLVTIVVAEEASRDIVREAAQRVGTDVLIKPVDSYELALTVERNMEHKSLERRKLLERDSEVLLSAIEALAAAIDAKDPLSAGHSSRVTDLCRQMADALSLSQEDRYALELSARLHDVGKIVLPDSMINKKSVLSEEEWRIMRQHPIAGAQMVGNIKELSFVANIIRHHHERSNGSGYPDGLRGEAIPYLSRILAVADAYEAMTSDRAYRSNFSSDEAMEQLQELSPEQFDSGILEALKKTLAETSQAVTDAA